MSAPILMQWIRDVGARKSPATMTVPSPSAGLLDEVTFARILRLECRRSERSGKLVMLVMVSSEDFAGKTNRRFMKGVTSTFTNCVRETDSLGWYRRNSTLGVLLTDAGTPDSPVADKIMRRLTHALQRHLSEEAYAKLEMSYLLFPQLQDTRTRGKAGRALYTERTARQIANMQAAAMKRSLDILGSVIALLALLPMMAVIALAVALSSEGPVLFCQERVGEHGRLFKFLKFRTMYANSDVEVHRQYMAKLIAAGADGKQGGALYKMANDPRVTPIGRFLRKSSLDELPQFFNVLVGHMSLVGPRPPLPYEYEHYKPWHRRRVMAVKPGLTGPWQVGGRSTTSFDDMVRMDLQYARTKSFLTDCRILLRTPAAVLSGRGAC